MDLQPNAVVSDYFVICTGTSERQLKALTDYVREEAKEQFGVIPATTEGISESGWIVMDYGYVVVHLFSEEKRQFYDLEGLWRTEGNILLSIQ